MSQLVAGVRVELPQHWAQAALCMCCCSSARNDTVVSENEGQNLTLRAALSQLTRSMLIASRLYDESAGLHGGSDRSCVRRRAVRL